MKAELLREINGRFLLNVHGDLHSLIHKFKWHTVEFNISQFSEKLKILLLSEIFLFTCRKQHVFRYNELLEIIKRS